MPLLLRHAIESCDHGPTRWLVETTSTEGRMAFATIRDAHPDIPAAMTRRAHACWLFHGPDAGDNWLVHEARRQFEAAVQAFGTGFSGLPEPVDFFYFHNTVDRFRPGISRDEPLAVYLHDSGVVLGPFTQDAARDEAAFSRQLSTLIRGLAEILKTVHDSGFVLRHLCPRAITWNAPARRYGIQDWLGITAIGESGFHPKIGIPTVIPGWSAPECYDGEGVLTPATDVYALGKAVLALLGHRMPAEPLLANFTGAVEAAQARFQGRIPERIRRFLLLALNPRQKQRLRDMDEVVGMLHDGPEPPPLPAAPTRNAPPPAGTVAARPPRPHKPLPQGPFGNRQGKPRRRRNRNRGGGNS
jgi:hypothetical protein